MKLYGTISPDKPLLVVALDEEAHHLHVLDMPVLVTEASKVNAGVAVAYTVATSRPSSVVNLGTAGALRLGLEGIHEIHTVVQHDLDDAALFALTGRHFGLPIQLQDAADDDGMTLATGDVFVADPNVRDRLATFADLVDMEGYAIASAARAAELPARIVKFVSDSADESAARSWRDLVNHGAEQLGAWAEQHLSHRTTD